MKKIPEFLNKNICKQVFTHRSYLNEVEDKNTQSNERLEFLGDSILSFVVSSYIYAKYKNLEEGELTNLRSLLTNTTTLYNTAKNLELGKYLKLSKGEEESDGRENKTILADTFEAMIGGLYEDQGIEKVKEFVNETLLKNLDEMLKTEELKDAKSRLQEMLQEEYKISPTYKILEEKGPDHAKIYTVGVYLKDKLLATGTGKSKQEAEKEAAGNALNLTFKD